MPEDEEHPYGHARMEYLAGTAVSIVIILVGVELGKNSLEKILDPTPLDFSPAVVIVLLIAIAVKIWQALFNINAGKKINSLALIATGTDSRNDVIATAVVLAHNHPSGIATPSQEDIFITHYIRDALQPLGITLYDHVIMTDDDMVSLKDSRHLNSF